MMIKATFNNVLDWIYVPVHLIFISVLFVVAYYWLSTKFWKHAGETTDAGVWKQNGALDIVTSVLLLLPAVVLVLSVIDLAASAQMSVTYLLCYYGLLILFFSFGFSLLEWHKNGAIEKAGKGWECELRCLLVSVQSMTGLGYTTARPQSVMAEVVAAAESLLGIFFIAIFVAKAVAAQTAPLMK